MKLYLDDIRPAPEGYTLVTTAFDAVLKLSEGGIEEISLDHDLGDSATGYDVLLWIELAVVRFGYKPPRMLIHSANPVGRQRMALAIEAIHEAYSTTYPDD